MKARSRVLLFDAAPELAGQLHDRLRQRGFAPLRLDVADAEPDRGPMTADLAVVLIDAAGAVERSERLAGLLRQLVSESVATLVWGPAEGLRGEGGALVEWLDPEVGLDEVVGKIGTLARYAPLLQGLERELQHLHRLGEQLNRHFGELDQEMRLAGRLQRDFLPRQLPQAPPFRFEVLFRPASWVSGDMYDVFRIDRHHLGMFVADAMGHGVAAGLLTMFLRQALVSKRVAGDSYSIVSPAEALENLHTCLVRQKLPNCQFVTAAYGILDTRSGEFHVGRAGHPYPLQIGRDGDIREVRSGGSLLGLADVRPDFEETRVVLAPGEKIIFYTDGVEDALVVPRHEVGEQTVFTEHLQRWAALSARGFIEAVREHLDRQESSLHPADDVTVLLAEVADGDGG